ncbi:Small RNA 2'-O-methyltransferase, partial [Stegodyphus mimosarum]
MSSGVKEKGNVQEEILEQSGPVFSPPLYLQRYTTVRDILYKVPGIEKVVDFGCAEGNFVKYLMKLPFVTEIACVDVNEPCLEQAAYRSKPKAWDFIFKRHEALSVKIFKGNVAEKDCRFQGFNAVTCIELIEHLEADDLLPLVSNIFGYIQPKIAIFTTPNCEFNVLFPSLTGFRHWDHKFEWSRTEFKQWCEDVTNKYPDYTVDIQGIGEPPSESRNLGCCSQLAVFKIKSPLNEKIILRNDNAEEKYILIDENKFPGRVKENLRK